jgi:hypothetical protein
MRRGRGRSWRWWPAPCWSALRGDDDDGGSGATAEAITETTTEASSGVPTKAELEGCLEEAGLELKPGAEPVATQHRTHQIRFAFASVKTAWEDRVPCGARRGRAAIASAELLIACARVGSVEPS